MNEIVLNDEQAEIVLSASSPVAVRDRTGRLWGYLNQSAFTAEDVNAVRRERAADQPRRTTAEVLKGLTASEQS